MQDGEPWFVLADVCAVLGIVTPHMVARRLPEVDRSQAAIQDARGHRQQTTIINEAGFYRVVLRSDSPKAEPLITLVTTEILPSIRDERAYKIAGYGTFEDYCRDRWDMARRSADQFIQGAEVVDRLSAIALKPTRESQARELAPLLNAPDRLREVWQAAVERHSGNQRRESGSLWVSTRPAAGRREQWPLIGPRKRWAEILGDSRTRIPDA
ncbi:Bro-N domain-containing protein [Pseudofrankia sp. BMG5.37]|uniref:BRO-N domain-containing protein n=1 Tax=Pseudofrankia sp. BMG5.37 TaxID=3050035 RepID=UPI002899B675|nr:Bro-N domain-containing protein [Pseudofrankia sp. BMG5.37]